MPTFLKLSETFSSLQGEGPSAGAPAFFVRLAHCNLRCVWCDTRYSWDFEQYDYHTEVKSLPVDELATRLRARAEGRVVITGGEPLLQQTALLELLDLLDPRLAIEIETNGTLCPEPGLSARVDQWNVSPKLAHAGDPEHRRIRSEALSALARTDRAFLKFVVSRADDLGEIQGLLAELAWPTDRVYLMPQAHNRAEHEAIAPMVAELCRQRGFRFSPRLHVLLWGGKRGR